MVSGIYCIENVHNGRRYIGSSQDMLNRWHQHGADLRKGLHVNSELQQAWAKFGEDAFRFTILEEVGAARLREREQFWIGDIGKTVSLYNVVAGAGSELSRRVRVSIVLDTKENEDLLRWLDRQPNKSRAVREALEDYLSDQITHADIYRAVRELGEKLDAGVVMAAAGDGRGTEKEGVPADIATALDALAEL